MRGPTHRPKGILARFRKQDDGSVALEFAVAISFALALIFAVIDVGRVYIVSGLLGDTVRQISRTNQVRPTPFTTAEFNADAAQTITDLSAGMIDAAQVVISTTVYEDFEALEANTTASGAPPGGDPEQIVRYSLTYTMDYYTPFVGLLMDTASFSHTAEIIVYNEPELPS